MYSAAFFYFISKSNCLCSDLVIRSFQLKKYEELHRSERSALRDLVRDYKILMRQKDGLIKENEKLQKEVTY